MLLHPTPADIVRGALVMAGLMAIMLLVYLVVRPSLGVVALTLFPPTVLVAIWGAGGYYSKPFQRLGVAMGVWFALMAWGSLLMTIFQAVTGIDT